MKPFLGDRALCDRRYVSDMIWCVDPAGYRLELVWNPFTANGAFVLGRPISGFKTGPYGRDFCIMSDFFDRKQFSLLFRPFFHFFRPVGGDLVRFSTY